MKITRGSTPTGKDRPTGSPAMCTSTPSPSRLSQENAAAGLDPARTSVPPDWYRHVLRLKKKRNVTQAIALPVERYSEPLITSGLLLQKRAVLIDPERAS